MVVFQTAIRLALRQYEPPERNVPARTTMRPSGPRRSQAAGLLSYQQSPPARVPPPGGQARGAPPARSRHVVPRAPHPRAGPAAKPPIEIVVGHVEHAALE